MKKLNFKDLNVTELKTEELLQVNGGLCIVAAVIGGASLGFRLYKFGFELGREYARDH